MSYEWRIHLFIQAGAYKSERERRGFVSLQNGQILISHSKIWSYWKDSEDGVYC